MSHFSFLKNKIRRQIAINGQEFCFYRYEVDKYHQESKESTTMATFNGLFHEATSYVNQTNSEGGRTVSKPQPMILALCNKETDALQKDDCVTIGNNVYRLVEKSDIRNLKIAYDISLEVVK